LSQEDCGTLALAFTEQIDVGEAAKGNVGVDGARKFAPLDQGSGQALHRSHERIAVMAQNRGMHKHQTTPRKGIVPRSFVGGALCKVGQIAHHRGQDCVRVSLCHQCRRSCMWC
jgi:hypothetical protein